MKTMNEEVKIGILLAAFFIVVIGGTVLFLNNEIFGPTYPIESMVNTTLARTVIPVPVPLTSPDLLPQQVSNYSEYGYGAWKFGEGVYYEKRLDLMPDSYAAASVTTTARLLNFFAMTDTHITDKESPAQAVYYGYKWGMISGYSPAMLYTTQFLDAAIQTANALHKEKPFDFGIFLGDGINSGQYNELRWYIDVLDGKTLKPDSGAMDDPVPGPHNDYQDEFKAAGLDRSIRWYQVLGNHDHFWMGLFPPDDNIKSTLTGNTILNIGNVFTDKLRIKSRGFYMGAVDGRTPDGEVTGAGPVKDFPYGPPTTPADPDRRFLSRTEWIGEFFNTSSGPAGHGFSQSDVTTGFACYTFEPRSDVPIRVIVLDDTQVDENTPDGSSNGHGSLDQERYDWLVKELDKGQAEGKLMIIAAHIPVGVKLDSYGLGSLLAWDKNAAVSDTDLIARLHTYPNLLMWISGHRHQNTVTALKSPDASHPELGFWEIETASLREFPQQFRTFEIVRNSDNTISIFATDVDPAVREGSLAAKSRSYAIAAHQIFNLTADPLPSGSYNAELVKPLSPEMQVKIQHYGTPITTH
jgi:metallophosphoesterase (TIGR03768 family)